MTDKITKTNTETYMIIDPKNFGEIIEKDLNPETPFVDMPGGIIDSFLAMVGSTRGKELPATLEVTQFKIDCIQMDVTWDQAYHGFMSAKRSKWMPSTGIRLSNLTAYISDWKVKRYGRLEHFTYEQMWQKINKSKGSLTEADFELNTDQKDAKGRPMRSMRIYTPE